MSDFVTRLARLGADGMDRARPPRGGVGAGAGIDGLAAAEERWAGPTAGSAPPGELARSAGAAGAGGTGAGGTGASGGTAAAEAAGSTGPAPGGRAGAPLSPTGPASAADFAPARRPRPDSSRPRQVGERSETPAGGREAPEPSAARAGDPLGASVDTRPRVPPRSSAPRGARGQGDGEPPSARAGTGAPEAPPTRTGAAEGPSARAVTATEGTGVPPRRSEAATARPAPPVQGPSAPRTPAARADGDIRSTDPHLAARDDRAGRAAPRASRAAPPAPPRPAHRAPPVPPPARGLDVTANGRGRSSTRPDHGDRGDSPSSRDRARDKTASAEVAVAEVSGERIEVRIGSVELRPAEPAVGATRPAAQDAALPSGFDDYAALRSYR